MVEEMLDKKLQELREKDQKKDDLRRAEQLIEILAMLKRHPELEAHISRELNPEGRHLQNLEHRPQGATATSTRPQPDVPPAPHPGAQGRRQPHAGRADGAAGERRPPLHRSGVGSPGTGSTVHDAKPNPWKDLAVRNGKRIYERKLNYGQLKLRFLQPHSGPRPQHPAQGCIVRLEQSAPGHIGYPGRCDLISRASKPVTAGYTTSAPTTRRAVRQQHGAAGNNTASHNNTASSQRASTHGLPQPSQLQRRTAAVYSHGSGESGRKGKAPPCGRRRSLRRAPLRPTPSRALGRVSGKKGKEKTR